MNWFQNKATQINLDFQKQALQHQAVLTKPAGSLGLLEDIAVQFSAMQSSDKPNVEKIYIAVFAADHGVMDENVSAFPQAVTAEMVRNFSRGGAAISVLAEHLNATLEVIDLGTMTELEPLDGVISKRISSATQNFCKQASMSTEQCLEALAVGRDSIDKAISHKAELFIGGDMGIGNTTTSAALACALLQAPAADLVGPGTGVDKKGVLHKQHVIEEALALHNKNNTDAFNILVNLGGYEIVALVGSYIRAAQVGLPCVIDGFITSVAALFANELCDGASDWFVYSHQSAEPGHAIVLKALNATPLLHLNMRLGEGSGAANAVSLIQNALVLHNNMATFEQAGVSEKN